MPLDLKRFRTLWGIMLTSTQPGEVASAASRMADLLKKAGFDWLDIPTAIEQRVRLFAEAQKLAAENNQLADQVERLKRRSSPGTVIDPWSNITGDPQKQAAWLLQLCSDGIIDLNTFEQSFLPNIVGWEGPITSKQRPVFERILKKYVQRTGRRPP